MADGRTASVTNEVCSDCTWIDIGSYSGGTTKILDQPCPDHAVPLKPIEVMGPLPGPPWPETWAQIEARTLREARAEVEAIDRAARRCH